MGMLTTAGRNIVLDHISGKTAMAQPTSFTLRFSSTTIGANGTYTHIEEIPDKTVLPTAFGAASAGTLTTTSDIETAAATGAGGTAVAAILIPNTGGVSMKGDLDTQKTITSGDPVRFRAGEITFSFID